jgi:CheY-like chemotaxis protein
MNSISVCSFPTTVLFIDDNKEFLNALFLDLKDENITYKAFTTPYNGLEYLNKECPPQPFLKKLISYTDEQEWEHRTLDLNIHDIYQEIYNPTRFKQVSTIVVDYDMPGMNGLEFCQKITIPHIRKIMLTGAADEHLAIEAFNKGLIHKFINKNSADLGRQLNKALRESTQTYFQEISQLFIHTLNVNWGTALTDPAFIELFPSLLENYNIIEYYLFQSNGSFLLIDREGKDYGFFIKEERELLAILESSEIETAPLQISQSLNSFQSMLCYHSQGDCSLPEGKKWGPYIYPTQKLEGRDVHYYALIPQILDLQREKIVPFEQYKKEFLQKL